MTTYKTIEQSGCKVEKLHTGRWAISKNGRILGSVLRRGPRGFCSWVVMVNGQQLKDFASRARAVCWLVGYSELPS